MVEKQFFKCPQCQSIYLLAGSDANQCKQCRFTPMEVIDGRFILRCKQCGMTQNKVAFQQMHGTDPLKCQSSTCNGSIKVIEIGRRNKEIKRANNPPDMKAVRSGMSQDQGIHPPLPKRRSLDPKKQDKKDASIQLAGILSQKSAPPAPAKLGNFQPFPESASLPEGTQDKIAVKDHPGIRDGDYLELNGEKYKIVEKLGTGGMGAVHKAQNLTTGKMVAVKEFFYTRYHDPETGDNHCERYWTRESQITEKQSESEEIVLHFIGALKLESFNVPEYYIFLEFIEGTPLDEWYTNKYKTLGDLSLEELRDMVKFILQPICRHMYYVHQKGIVHRDLTVQNIIIQEKDGKFIPIIIDWGVAKEIGIGAMYNPRKPYYIASAPEATGIRNRGTPPEVMAGFHPIAVTDVYMLGHIMYFLFSGGHYAGTAATNEDFVLHPGDYNPDLPDDFNKIVEYMTQYEPADRMPNMVKVYEALEWLYGNTQPPTETTPSYQFALYCDWNDGKINLVEKQIIEIGRDEIVAAGKNHEMDGHLYNALIPKENGKYQFSIYIDGGYAYIRDLYSKKGTYLNNLTATNQQVYNDIPIQGLDNVVIILSEKNLGHTTIEIVYDAPDGVTYRIPFKLMNA